MGRPLPTGMLSPMGADAHQVCRQFDRPDRPATLLIPFRLQQTDIRKCLQRRRSAALHLDAKHAPAAGASAHLAGVHLLYPSLLRGLPQILPRAISLAEVWCHVVTAIASELALSNVTHNRVVTAGLHGLHMLALIICNIPEDVVQSAAWPQ